MARGVADITYVKTHSGWVVELQRRIVKHRAAIDASPTTGLSTGLIEFTNTKIRVLTCIAFGLHRLEPLIALALLSLGGHCPALPGRN